MLLHTWYTFLGNSLGNSSGCASISGFLLFMKIFFLCYFDELGVFETQDHFVWDYHVFQLLAELFRAVLGVLQRRISVLIYDVNTCWC